MNFSKIDFQMDLLRKVFCFKIKGINLKATKHKKQNTKQKKNENKITKWNFWQRANSSGENGGQSSLFFYGIR